MGTPASSCLTLSLTSRTNASCASTQSSMLGSLAKSPDTTLWSADRLALAKSCGHQIMRSRQVRRCQHVLKSRCSFQQCLPCNANVPAPLARAARESAS